MKLLLDQLGQLAMVVIIMVCSLFGTAGIIKLIKKIFPFGDFRQSSFDTGKRNSKNHEDTEVRK